jgi:hypothetical protein
MPDANPADDAPAPCGPFFANFGPLDDPIVGRGDSRAIAVVADRGSGIPIGIAHPGPLVRHSQGMMKPYRLVISDVELEGRWICVGGEFVRLGDAAEELWVTPTKTLPGPYCVGEAGRALNPSGPREGLSAIFRQHTTLVS